MTDETRIKLQQWKKCLMTDGINSKAIVLNEINEILESDKLKQQSLFEKDNKLCEQ